MYVSRLSCQYYCDHQLRLVDNAAFTRFDCPPDSWTDGPTVESTVGWYAFSPRLTNFGSSRKNWTINASFTAIGAMPVCLRGRMNRKFTVAKGLSKNRIYFPGLYVNDEN